MAFEFPDGFKFHSKARALLAGAAEINILDILGRETEPNTEPTGMPRVTTKPAEPGAAKSSDLQIDKDDKIEQYLGQAKKLWKNIDKNHDDKLSHAEISQAKTTNTDAGNSEFLDFLDHNFDSVSTLNATTGNAPQEITTKQFDYLADLHRQSQLDRKYFEPATELALKNFQAIDANNNGQIDSYEISTFRKSSNLDADQTSQLKYLEMRLKNNYSRADVQGKDAEVLPYGNQFSASRASNYFDSYALSRVDLKTTTLAERIEATQRGIYGQLNTEHPIRIGEAVGTVLGAAPVILLSKNFRYNPWQVMGGSAVGFTAGHFLGKEVGHYMGRNFYDAHQRSKMEHLQI